MKTLLAAIMLTTTTLFGADLVLTWQDNSDNEDGFEIWRQQNGGEWLLIAATNAERVGHPTQKPVRVMARSLDFAPNAQTVCDPFMGSGTTGVACAQLGKAFTGIERERKYFDIACERIARAQAQGQMFAPESAALPTQQAMEL